MTSNSGTGTIAKIRSAGLFAKGVVYILIGALTFMAAIGEGGDVASTDGVIRFFLGLPFGKVIGGTVAIGLAAYSIWRFYQVIFLPNENKQNDKFKSSFRRIRFFYSGAIYGFLAYSFAKPLIEEVSGSGNSGTPPTAIRSNRQHWENCFRTTGANGSYGHLPLLSGCRHFGNSILHIQLNS